MDEKWDQISESDVSCHTEQEVLPVDVDESFMEDPVEPDRAEKRESQGHIGWATKLIYGQGHAVDGMRSYTFSTFVFFYYNQVLGLSPHVCGAATFLALISDSLVDPIVGYLSDGWQSKLWGRRHPFLAFAVLPIFVSLMLVFTPLVHSDHAASVDPLVVWLVVVYPLCRVCFSFFEVPYKALGAELSSNLSDRTHLFSASEACGLIGYGTVPILGYPLFFPSTAEYPSGVLDPAAYPRFALCLGLLMGMSITLLVVGTKHHIPAMNSRGPNNSTGRSKNFFSSFRQLCHNRNFRVLLLANILHSTVHSIEPTLSLYVNVHFWGMSSEQIGLQFLPAGIGIPVAFAVAPWLTRHYHKRTLVMSALAIYSIAASTCIGLRLLGWSPPNESKPRLYFIAAALVFMTGSYAIAGITLDSMIADTADEIKSFTGRRVEGMLFATRSFSSKAASSVGGMLGGVMLWLIAFPKQAKMGQVPEDVVFKLGLFYGPLINVLSIFCVLVYYQYDDPRAGTTDKGYHEMQNNASTPDIDPK
uniref:Major facilitator superfamily (MFS) profile domain-containing protein n=1 Tax=Eutreptiella gymnastica TaxID=73025 RepID=A0A7S1NLG5_9EUGL|mmetsp:Transcript_54652/g.97169  ORF Transcript_54652/g.97169 Transcript_54652/m.97169 type:complete len:531 (+) Transcript_54652:107-1699(+)